MAPQLIQTLPHAGYTQHQSVTMMWLLSAVAGNGVNTTVSMVAASTAQHAHIEPHDTKQQLASTSRQVHHTGQAVGKMYDRAKNECWKGMKCV